VWKVINFGLHLGSLRLRPKEITLDAKTCYTITWITMNNVPWVLGIFFQVNLFEVSSMNIIVTHGSQKNVDIHLWYSLMFTIFFENGWKSFKVYHTRRKGPSPYCSPFLPYILIPIKYNESKVIRMFRKNLF